MKAIIKAAGLGSRLMPLTNEIPKTLVKINGKPILGNILDALIAINASPIVIIVGYKAQKIIDFCIKNYPKTIFHFIFNPEYATKNPTYSMYLAKEHMNEDLIMLNCDVIFDKEILFDLVKQPNSIIVVDEQKKQYSPKVIINGGKIVEINDNIPLELVGGTSLDILKLLKNEAIIFKNGLVELIEIKNQIKSRNELITDLIKHKHMTIFAYNVSGKKWQEIDNLDDLKKAEELFK